MKRASLIVPAAAAGAGAAYWFLLRPRHLRWGATEAEASGPLPGDDLIPAAGPASTHAVTIHAPPEAVWPWVAQLGQNHAGFYSYTALENLLGCQMRNTHRIVPEWQQIRVGDPV